MSNLLSGPKVNPSPFFFHSSQFLSVRKINKFSVSRAPMSRSESNLFISILIHCCSYLLSCLKTSWQNHTLTKLHSFQSSLEEEESHHSVHNRWMNEFPLQQRCGKCDKTNVGERRTMEMGITRVPMVLKDIFCSAVWTSTLPNVAD